jgi:hypothetical protein
LVAKLMMINRMRGARCISGKQKAMTRAKQATAPTILFLCHPQIPPKVSEEQIEQTHTNNALPKVSHQIQPSRRSETLTTKYQVVINTMCAKILQSRQRLT